MKTFEVYRDSRGYVELVKQGWSWPAFFFHWLWALVHQLYGMMTLALLALTALTILNTTYRFEVNFIPVFDGATLHYVLPISALQLVLGLCFGYFGNLRRKIKLNKRGYQFIQTIHAKSYGQACSIFDNQQANLVSNRG